MITMKLTIEADSITGLKEALEDIRCELDMLDDSGDLFGLGYSAAYELEDTERE